MAILTDRNSPALWLMLVVCVILPARAQLTLDGHPIQVHGFFTQGFTYSNVNNYLTMPSSDGSFAFTDAGLNVSTQITDKLRVGAQAYIRDVGQLGKGHLTLDWASGDYKFNDYFGIRIGKVKTVLGLHNDTQDIEFLHTWAILPQSLYALDLRGAHISHLGGDVYGSVTPGRLGTFSYTAHLGTLPADRAGGYQYGIAAFGVYIRNTSGVSRGLDIKWNTPLAGLDLGGAYSDSPETQRGDNLNLGGPFYSRSSEHTTFLSAQYTHGPLHLEYENSRLIAVSHVISNHGPFLPLALDFPSDARGWYASAAFRISRRLELGTYHSRYYPNADRQPDLRDHILSELEKHIYDQAVTARLDLKSYLDLKIEGHFINGFGDASAIRGFYPQDNPDGLKPKTNLLVIRVGFNF